MDLTNKNKVDFVDAHLWGGSVEFHCSCMIKNLPMFFPIVHGIRMIVHPHLDNTERTDYYAHIEFVCEYIHADVTPNLLKRLIEIAYNACGGPIEIYSEGWAARIDNEGRILERRELNMDGR